MTHDLQSPASADAPRLYSRSDLAALDGVDDGALAFWLREGILVPEPAEPRKHRRFSEGEAKIAAILGEARSIGLNVTALRHLAAGVRGALRFHENVLAAVGHGATPDKKMQFVEQARLDMEALYLAQDVLTSNNAVIGLRPSGGGAWLVRSMPHTLKLGSRVEVLFNLDRILAPFREGRL